MKTRYSRDSEKNLQRAFTLKELLAVLVILGFVATAGLAAMGGARDRSIVAQCESNLRQFTLAVMIYGGENNDKLPGTSGGSGFWAWDLPWAAGNSLNSYGAPWQAMYCPGTAFRFSPSENFALYNYASGVFHVVDYALTFGVSSLNPSNVNSSISPQSIPTGPLIFPPPVPSKRVLLADATLNPTAIGSGPWDSIQGGYAKAHTSAHLLGPVPAGGNVAFLDTHVEWRPFSQMVVRTSATGAPYFFW